MSDPMFPDEKSPSAVMKTHDEADQGHMTLWEHLEELRWVIIKAGSVFMLAAIVIGIGAVQFKELVEWPLDRGIALAGAEALELRTRGSMEIFGMIFQLIFFGAIGVSLPFVLYFLAGFIAPGLTARERALLRPVCLSLLALFFAGCALAYFMVLPAMFAVSIFLNDLFGYQELWAPGEVYGTVVSITLAMGLVFEFPVILVALIYLDILEISNLRQGRRYAFVIIIVFAAFITPTGDPLSLFMVSLPLYALYEGAIIVGQRLLRRRDPMDDW